MEKRTNKYHLKLELLATAKVDETIYAPIELEFDNHDNIFTIVERMKQRNLFHTEKVMNLTSPRLLLPLHLFEQPNKEYQLFFSLANPLRKYKLLDISIFLRLPKQPQHAQNNLYHPQAI